jgi:hypothetical protein
MLSFRVSAAEVFCLHGLLMWYFNLVHELDAFQLGSTALLLEFNFPRFAGNYYAEKY